MVFTEKQKFNQPWIWIGLIIMGVTTIGMFGLAFYRQIIQGKKFGNNPMSDNALIIVFILITLMFFLLILLFVFAKLTTVIDKNGVAFRFFPFQFRFTKIAWSEIESAEVITYNPIRECGGWGIKYNKKGKVFNVAGDKGLQLQLRNGKTILIGTQQSAGLAKYLSIC